MKNHYNTIFEEGFDSSKFIISTVIEREKDGSFSCKGRVIQGRGKEDAEGEVEWDDRVIYSEAQGKNSNELNTLVLNSMFQYLIKKDFYLFEDEENAGKDDLQEV